MGTKGSANRQRIVEAADHLFYSRGYNQTSFSDISDETGIPRGNFYYYFKTKEDILSAVVESRLNYFQQMLETCNERSSDPRERLLMFAQLPIDNQEDIVQYGCPIGTLSSELVKEQDNEISKAKMNAVFDLLRKWSIEQFEALSCGQNSQDYAMDLLAKIQGATIIANVYNDKDFLQRACQDTKDWINKRCLS